MRKDPFGSNESAMKIENDNCDVFNHVVVAQLVKASPGEISRTLVTSVPSHRQRVVGLQYRWKNKHNKSLVSRETGRLCNECGATLSPLTARRNLILLVRLV